MRLLSTIALAAMIGSTPALAQRAGTPIATIQQQQADRRLDSQPALPRVGALRTHDKQAIGLPADLSKLAITAAESAAIRRAFERMVDVDARGARQLLKAAAKEVRTGDARFLVGLLMVAEGERRADPYLRENGTRLIAASRPQHLPSSN